MAVGDAAGAKGLQTYSDTLLVKDIDTALNQRGDDIAATMTRLDKVEAAVNQPIFSVKRSTTEASIPASIWYVATAALATNADINDGFTWDNATGQLKVTKAGICRLGGSLFYQVAPDDAGLEITRNSDQTGTAATVVGKLTPGRGVEATGLVRLAVGDIIRMHVFQRNTAGTPRLIGTSPYNLTLTAEWVRA